MSASGETATAPEALALLPLDLTGLSGPQQQGTICVHDGSALGPDAVDLGRRHNGRRSVFPRACRPCAAILAEAAIADHKAHCEACVEGDIPCEIRAALNVLTRGLRR